MVDRLRLLSAEIPHLPGDRVCSKNALKSASNTLRERVMLDG